MRRAVNPNPIPVPPAAPAPKKTSGCVVALLVVLGLALVLCLGGGVALWVAARSDTGKQVMDAIDKGVKLAEKGVNAPGAAEVRAAGCPQAVVLDTKEMVGLVAGFIDGGLKADELGGAMVLCQGPFGAELPECDALAPVYAKAASPAEPFVVEVKKQGQSKASCQRRYRPDGTFLEDVKDGK